MRTHTRRVAWRCPWWSRPPRAPHPSRPLLMAWPAAPAATSARASTCPTLTWLPAAEAASRSSAPSRSGRGQSATGTCTRTESARVSRKLSAHEKFCWPCQHLISTFPLVMSTKESSVQWFVICGLIVYPVQLFIREFVRRMKRKCWDICKQTNKKETGLLPLQESENVLKRLNISDGRWNHHYKP